MDDPVPLIARRYGHACHAPKRFGKNRGEKSERTGADLSPKGGGGRKKKLGTTSSTGKALLDPKKKEQRQQGINYETKRAKNWTEYVKAEAIRKRRVARSGGRSAGSSWADCSVTLKRDK